MGHPAAPRKPDLSLAGYRTRMRRPVGQVSLLGYLSATNNPPVRPMKCWVAKTERYRFSGMEYRRSPPLLWSPAGDQYARPIVTSTFLHRRQRSSPRNSKTHDGIQSPNSEYTAHEPMKSNPLPRQQSIQIRVQTHLPSVRNNRIRIQSRKTNEPRSRRAT